jgi:hypothetical protein
MLYRAIAATQCLKPQHRGMFALDIASFSRRDPDLQLYLRTTLYHIAEESCAAAGICWANCYREDRGDGFLVITPAELSIDNLLNGFVTNLRTSLRKNNKVASASAQLALRMAIHAGYVYLDDHGAAGTAVTHLTRLLDAPAFRAGLTSRSELALIVSDYLYQEIIGYAPGHIDPCAFQALTVEVKETISIGWIWKFGREAAGDGQLNGRSTPHESLRSFRSPSQDGN